jgi:hypothetical protein
MNEGAHNPPLTCCGGTCFDMNPCSLENFKEYVVLLLSANYVKTCDTERVLISWFIVTVADLPTQEET